MLPPLSLLCPPREVGPPMRRWATTVRAPHVCVCVNTHTVVRKCCTSLLYYLDNRSAVGEKTIMRRVLWHLWYFHNKTRSGGYLGHGWEGIGSPYWTTTWRRMGLLGLSVQSGLDWCGSGRTRDVGEPDAVVWDSLYLHYISHTQLLAVIIYSI